MLKTVMQIPLSLRELVMTKARASHGWNKICGDDVTCRSGCCQCE